jgi:hypothetical protein
MSESLPDRLAVNPKSPFHDADLLERGIGIRFNGVERNDVEEYCVSEGWIKVAYGKSRDRHGNPMMMKLNGTVEPFRLLDDDSADG